MVTPGPSCGQWLCAWLDARWRGVALEYRNYFIQVSASEPAWSDEVQKWRKNASYAPAIWPPGWPPLDWKPDMSKRK